MSEIHYQDPNASEQNRPVSPSWPLPVAENADFMLRASMGRIPGISSVNKFGANENSADGVWEEIWDGSVVYTFPVTALMVKLSQTADQAAMRGKTIEVQGLDANWALTIQNVVLDATLTTTPVVLTTPLIRVFRMKVLANVVSNSPIRLHDAAESTDYAIIGSGNNQTLMAIYTVPVGKTAYMTSYYGDYVRTAVKDPDSVEIYLWAADRAAGYEFQVKHAKGIPKQAPGFLHEFKPYAKFTEKTDIKLMGKADGAVGDIHGGFDLILADNSIYPPAS